MNFAKTFSRKNMLINGITIGGGLGASKGGEIVKNNPYLDETQKENAVLGNTAKGAALGTIGAGIAGHYLRGAAKGLGMLKKSEFEVPSDDGSIKDDSVKDCPNNEEIDRMNHCVDSRQKYKDLIEKMSAYQTDILCECGYAGTPLEDGRCPKCGRMNGSNNETEDSGYGRTEDDFLNQRAKINETYNAIQRSKSEDYNNLIQYL